MLVVIRQLVLTQLRLHLTTAAAAVLLVPELHQHTHATELTLVDGSHGGNGFKMFSSQVSITQVPKKLTSSSIKSVQLL